MIRLDEAAIKIENILNGIDPEVVALGLQNPTGFYFKVATEGFHIDKINDMGEGKNFIPVFISSMGGQFNPVPDLLQANYVIPIAIYAPVRWKNDLFALNEYLAQVFVGRQLNYGKYSGKAVSNISVAQFGEIQDLDLKQFMEWEQTVYKMPIEVMEPFIQMQFNLYLSSAAEGIIFGNDVTLDLKFSYDGEEYELKNVAFESGSLQSNSQTQNEQLEGTNESVSIPFSTTYGSSIKIYPNINIKGTNNELFFKEILKAWFNGYVQLMECDATFKFADDQELVFSRKCVIQSIVSPIERGQPFSLTLTFVTKEIEEEEE